MEGILLYAVSIAAGFVGMVIHFVKKKGVDPNFPALRDYFLKNRPVYSLFATIATVIGSAALAAATGHIPIEGAALSVYLGSCAAVGLGCDSLINRYVDESGIHRS